jgi:hypothetical protein
MRAVSVPMPELAPTYASTKVSGNSGTPTCCLDYAIVALVKKVGDAAWIAYRRASLEGARGVISADSSAVVRNLVLVLLYALAVRTSLRLPPVDATAAPAHAPSPVHPDARQAS